MMAYRTTLDLVPLDWTEHSSICCPWWPKAIVFFDDKGADSDNPIERRCWSTQLLGIRPWVVEDKEGGHYHVLYQGRDAKDGHLYFDTLSEAQDHVFDGLLNAVAECVSVSAELIVQDE